jgi:hypothetical protein
MVFVRVADCVMLGVLLALGSGLGRGDSVPVKAGDAVSVADSSGVQVCVNETVFVAVK